MAPIFFSAYIPGANASSIGNTLTSPTVSTFDSDQHTYIIKTHQQVTISTSVKNPHDNPEVEPLTLLAEVRDGEDISIFFAFQSITLKPLQEYSAGFSWSSDETGEYEIRVFAISDLNNPMILSDIRSSPIIVTDDEELLKNAEKITLFDYVPWPDFYEQSEMNYTINQIADQHELLCGDKYSDFNSMLRSMRQDNEYLPYWFPQRVGFHYLQSNETFFRQPCTEVYTGVTQDEVFAYYVMRGNETVGLDSLNPADLFQIETIEQALEYLAYFTYHGDNAYGIGIIPASGYQTTSINCDITIDSPIRFIRVTEQDDKSMIIELNVNDAGSVEYQKWQFESGSAPLLVSSVNLGLCPAIE